MPGQTYLHRYPGRKWCLRLLIWVGGVTACVGMVLSFIDLGYWFASDITKGRVTKIEKLSGNEAVNSRYRVEFFYYVKGHKYQQESTLDGPLEFSLGDEVAVYYMLKHHYEAVLRPPKVWFSLGVLGMGLALSLLRQTLFFHWVPKDQRFRLGKEYLQ